MLGADYNHSLLSLVLYTQLFRRGGAGFDGGCGALLEAEEAFYEG